MTKEVAAKLSTDLAQPYEPTPQERAVVVAQIARKKRRPPTPRIKVSGKSGTVEVSIDHPKPSLGQMLLMEALGTTDVDFVNGLLGQLINIGAPGNKADERGLNFVLAMVKGIAPQDDAECMLAAQMAAVHMATMTFARRLAHVDNIPQQDSAERAFNKLARTFAVQLEALRRYRTGGEQKVTVHHVTVNEGGRAIVGTVSTAAGGVGHDGKSAGQPCISPAGLAHDTAAGTVLPPLRSTYSKQEAVPVTSDGQRTL